MVQKKRRAASRKPVRKAAPAKRKPVAPAPKPIKPPRFTAAEMKAIRRRLTEEEARIRAAMREQSDEELGDAGAVGDVVDAASNAATQFLTLGLATSEARTLKEIREAIGRIEKDAYGVCRRCGGGVERERLQALPWAPTCVACRREEERHEQAKEPRARTAAVPDYNTEG